MNRAAGKVPAQDSGLQAEARRLTDLLQRALTLQLDRFFELTTRAARRRRFQVALVVLVVAILLVGAHLLLRLDATPGLLTDRNAGTLLTSSFIIVLRVILILGLTISVGLHSAGNFLADIFELRDTRTAWQFIGRLAGGAGDEVLHLREGKIADAEANSPLAHIGGPGRIVVDFDTAALFEKPDGTARVVGGYDGGATTQAIQIEGFERLREPIIDLRDQYIGTPSGEPLSVVGRSLDGMPISVTDVRGVFSVRRDAARRVPSLVEHPFPFRAGDIENLIYNQTVEVLTGGEHASGLPGDWTSIMHVLIRESLREFMSQNRLTDFLAGVGVNEAERSEFRADTILSKTLEVSSEIPGAMASRATPTPRFQPRTELSNKFKKYGSEFSTRAQAHGLELHWIGVGTWKMPDESSEAAMTAKHLEAWRMSRENSLRSDERALERVAEAALLEHKLRLIEDVPIRAHQQNKERYTDKIVLQECLLQDFWQQMGDALDIHYRSGTPPAELKEIEEAVLAIERLLRISPTAHVIGGGTMSRVRRDPEWKVSRDAPPAPASRTEAQKYQTLLSKLQGDYRVAEAMIANEQRRHVELSREQLIARIVERFERHAR